MITSFVIFGLILFALFVWLVKQDGFKSASAFFFFAFVFCFLFHAAFLWIRTVAP